MAIFKVKKRYYVKVMRSGVYYRAEHGYIKKEDAREAEAYIKSQLKKIQAQNNLNLNSPLFIETWNEYLHHAEVYNSKSWFDTKRYASKKFQQWFGRPITSITVGELEAHFIERKKISNRSSNLDFEILKNFFNFCEQRDYIVSNPFRKGLKPFPRIKKERIIPPIEEINKLIESNEGNQKLLILLLVCTMGRISEIKNLQWADVDLEKKSLYLRTHKTRDGSEKLREIPINGRLYEALQAIEQRTGYVLQGGKDYHSLRLLLSKCYHNAGLPEPEGFHLLRHSSISRLGEAGVPINVIQDLAGHQTLAMTLHYSHASDQSKRNAINQLTQ